MALCPALCYVRLDVRSTLNAVLFDARRAGIIGIGAWVNFGTECNNVSKLFPGINLRVCTLASNFKVPLFRDYIMSLGFIRYPPARKAERALSATQSETEAGAPCDTWQCGQALGQAPLAVRPGPCNRDRRRWGGRGAGRAAWNL